MIKAANIAAKWWADRLDGKTNHDNGDAMTSAFANFLAESLEPVTPEQYCKFREVLEAEFEGILELKLDFTVGTDYDPDPTLQKAIQAAGIDRANIRLPIKTIMWMYGNKVQVSCGYRAPIETIWEETDTK